MCNFCKGNSPVAINVFEINTILERIQHKDPLQLVKANGEELWIVCPFCKGNKMALVRSPKHSRFEPPPTLLSGQILEMKGDHYVVTENGKIVATGKIVVTEWYEFSHENNTTICEVRSPIR